MAEDEDCPSRWEAFVEYFSKAMVFVVLGVLVVVVAEVVKKFA